MPPQPARIAWNDTHTSPLLGCERRGGSATGLTLRRATDSHRLARRDRRRDGGGREVRRFVPERLALRLTHRLWSASRWAWVDTMLDRTRQRADTTSAWKDSVAWRWC